MLRFDESPSINITQTDLNRGVTPERIIRLKQILIYEFSQQNTITIPLDILRDIIQLSNSVIVVSQASTHGIGVDKQDNMDEFVTALETIYQDYIKALDL